MRKTLFASLLILAGCSPTPYKELDSSGTGVGYNKLNHSVFEIRARGNEVTDSSTTKDHALLKAAELCIENGFAKFIPLQDNSTTNTEVFANPTYLQCTGTYCYTVGGGVSTYTLPRHDMTVKFFTDKEEAPNTAYSCSIIYEALAPKYLNSK